MIVNPNQTEEVKSEILSNTNASNDSLNTVNPLSLQTIGIELISKVNKINPRLLNMWKKILGPQRESAVISCCFLLLYCEIDSSLKISPNARIPIDKAISITKSYLANPGYVVTIVKRTKDYIEKEMISVETIQRIYGLISKLTDDQVRDMDASFTGLALYELIVWAVKYYDGYVKEYYKFDIFDDISEVPLPEIPIQSVDIGNTSSPASYDPQPYTQKSHPTFKPPTPTKPKPNSDFITNTSLETLKTTKSSKPSNPSPSSSPSKIPRIPLKPNHTQKSIQQSSPNKSSPLKLPPKTPIEIPENSPKAIDRNIMAAKKIIHAGISKSNNSTPLRKNLTEGSIPNDFLKTTTRDVLEIMQYHQLVEERFRHFLIEKLKKETEKLEKTGMEKNDIKIINQRKAIKNKIKWVEEFEKSCGMNKFNSIKRICDEKRYNEQLLRSQRQFEILERYNNMM